MNIEMEMKMCFNYCLDLPKKKRKFERLIERATKRQEKKRNDVPSRMAAILDCCYIL